ncbi:MAG TPA: glutamate-cysteine ligase family protein [Gammaproteobacteria bacterium]|nr:glutamate-cysteine ligase family protein [Gammaproteobacteria bacterium]
MTETVSPLSLYAGYGIELEYMIVDCDHLDVLPVTDRILKKIAGEYTNEVERGEVAWSNELVLHVIELKTNGPAASLEKLPPLFLDNLNQINTIVADINGCLMPTAMHPWMDPYRETHLWTHEASEIYDTYNRIFNCQGHGWSNLQSMHINLPFANDEEFALLHAAIRILMPIMPALAASSPIMDGECTGLMDTRLETYRRNAERIPSITGLVIPEPVSSRNEYIDKILQPMYRDIAEHDPEKILQHEWLNSRGAIARFDRNTIEIRVLDTQETPRADIAIAAIITSILKKLTALEWSGTEEQNHLATEKLADIFMATVRNGEKAIINNRDYLQLFGFPDCRGQVQEVWQYLLETIPDNTPELNPELKKTIGSIIHTGPLARRIKLAVGQNAKQSYLRETYRQLCECLVNNRLFEGLE